MAKAEFSSGRLPSVGMAAIRVGHRHARLARQLSAVRDSLRYLETIRRYGYMYR
jgi:hypothetical protein